MDLIFIQVASDGDGFGAAVVWAVIAAVIIGLYFLNRASRRKADDAYWKQRTFEERLKANDPDMAQDED